MRTTSAALSLIGAANSNPSFWSYPRVVGHMINNVLDLFYQRITQQPVCIELVFLQTASMSVKGWFIS